MEFFYLPSSGIVSCVGTVGTVYCKTIQSGQVMFVYLMMSSIHGAPEVWASLSSRVHICATEYRQLITTCMCPNKCSSQSHVLFGLQQHTTIIIL